MKYKLPKFKFVLTKQLIEDGECLPKGYGFAWRDFDTAAMIAYPIPFNKIIGWLRNIWHWFKDEVNPSLIDKSYRKGWKDGHVAGTAYNEKVFSENVNREVNYRINEMDLDRKRYEFKPPANFMNPMPERKSE